MERNLYVNTVVNVGENNYNKTSLYNVYQEINYQTCYKIVSTDSNFQWFEHGNIQLVYTKYLRFYVLYIILFICLYSK